MRMHVVPAVAAVLASLGAGGAYAVMTANTIDERVTLLSNLTQAKITGPIECTRGERVRIRATLAQRSTGAWGEGIWNAACTGSEQRWEVRATARSDERFEAGDARVCALATTRMRRVRTDAHQWCRDVRIAGGSADARAAAMTNNTIERHAHLDRRGRTLRAGGPITCDRGERVAVRATFAQRSTGAVGERTWRSRCTGEPQRWHVTIRASGRERFELGTAEVVALGRTTAGGTTTDAHVWSREAELER